MLKIGNVIIDEKEIMYITTTTFQCFKPEINVVFKYKEIEKLVKKLVGGK